MTRRAFITTSWDDGHPLDLRVAEMLTRHGLPGTFYIPRASEFGTMNEAQIRELSANFEVGGHTLGHVVLTQAVDTKARQEIAGCKVWVEHVTGCPCVMFCPPTGRFQSRHLEMARAAGFAGVRGVDLLSLDAPQTRGGLRYMPTSVQAFPHDRSAYVRNVVKRRAWRSLADALFVDSRDWLQTSRSLLERLVARGGVFHLWGHSWEIERHGLWGRLEDALRMLAEFAPHAPARTNGDLCVAAFTGAAA